MRPENAQSATGWGRSFPAESSRPPEPAPAAATHAVTHLGKLFLLVRGKDLRQPGIDFFLQILSVFLLLRREFEPLCHCRRKDLANLRKAASTKTSTWPAAGAAGRSL